MNNSIDIYNEESYLFFSIGNANYAFKSNCVLTVMQLVELEYPESMPNYIMGLLEYNNSIIKIVDLCKVLNLENQKYTLNSKIIIVKAKNDIFGIIADNIIEIKRIISSSFGSMPYSSSKSYVLGIYTDKDFSSTLINLENIEKKINEKHYEDDCTNSLPLLLPSDLNSKEVLHRRKMHYTRKMREISNIIIESQDTYITFLLDRNICCLKILHVLGFYKLSNIKLVAIPCTPSFIRGVANLKGRYITILDLLQFSENKETKITKDTNIILVEHEDYQIGILADAIGETIEVDENVVKQIREKQSGCLKECVINNEVHLFLDIKKLFENEKLYIS